MKSFVLKDSSLVFVCSFLPKYPIFTTYYCPEGHIFTRFGEWARDLVVWYHRRPLTYKKHKTTKKIPLSTNGLVRCYPALRHGGTIVPDDGEDKAGNNACNINIHDSQLGTFIQPHEFVFNRTLIACFVSSPSGLSSSINGPTGCVRCKVRVCEKCRVCLGRLRFSLQRGCMFLLCAAKGS